MAKANEAGRKAGELIGLLVQTLEDARQFVPDPVEGEFGKDDVDAALKAAGDYNEQQYAPKRAKAREKGNCVVCWKRPVIPGGDLCHPCNSYLAELERRDEGE